MVDVLVFFIILFSILYIVGYQQYIEFIWAQMKSSKRI